MVGLLGLLMGLFGIAAASAGGKSDAAPLQVKTDPVTPDRNETVAPPAEEVAEDVPEQPAPETDTSQASEPAEPTDTEENEPKAVEPADPSDAEENEPKVAEPVDQTVSEEEEPKAVEPANPTDAQEDEPKAADPTGAQEDEPTVAEPADIELVDIVQVPVRVDHETITDSPVEVMSGRTHTLDIEGGDDIASVKITAQADFGNITVNPDNSLAVVLTGTTETGNTSFGYEVTHNDGSVTLHEGTLNVVEGVQDLGWGQGDFYMLEVDDNDDVIVEEGENHRKIHVSNDEDALTREDIAILEGLEASQINKYWLANMPEYGSSPETALAPDVGIELFQHLTGPTAEPSSTWLLFESGYEYDGTAKIIHNGVSGEDELHPIHITSYGEGDLPVLTEQMYAHSGASENLVITKLEFAEGIYSTQGGENILMDDIILTGDETVFKSMDGITLRNSEIRDVYRVKEDGEDWDDYMGDRISGIYASGSEGMLFEGLFIAQNGWDDSEGGQVPSMFSHNVYLQHNTFDVTFRDNITMQGASFGAQLRGGGFIEDNVILDNNAAISFRGGDYLEYGTVGNYTLFTDNLITSGAHNESPMIGGLTYGVQNNGELSSMVGNIIAHAADPNNPDEIAEKTVGHSAQYLDKDPLYNDTIVYNWRDAADVANDTNIGSNVDGLDRDVLDQTTIQNFIADFLDVDGATIDDLEDYLRDQSNTDYDDDFDADQILAYFQSGFGISTDVRASETTLRFVPNDLGDGVRWDNRLNWSTDDLPGTQDGDSVDLGGNWVNYSGTASIENLEFGTGGVLNVGQGKLSVEGEVTSGENGGTFDISGAGQLWMNGFNDTDALSIDVDGGRFVNTGDINGNAQITISDGEAILASDDGSITIGEGSDIHIIGDQANVGFAGSLQDTAVLLMETHGSITFEAKDDAFGQIAELDSSAFDDDVQSGVNLDQGTLRLVLEENMSSGTEVLFDVDEIVGTFEQIEVFGLSNNQDAEITVDFETDQVLLTLSDDGSGKVTYAEPGNAATDTEASSLWDALTGHMAVLSETAMPEIETYDLDEFVAH